MTHAHETAGPCPVCGAAGARFLFTAHDLHSLIPGDHALFSCPACTHVFVYPQPAPEEMARHYAGDYWADMEEAHDVTAGVRRLATRVARAYPGGRVLDVGCAAGKKTAAMRDLGLQVVGLEPYEAGCRLARERYGLEVVCAYLQHADLPPASFDAVTFFDVLEHVHDPVGDLRAAYALLKPGGGVYVKAPNVRSWQARLFGRWWAVLDPPRHLHHFTPRSLPEAIGAAGFSDIRRASPPDPLGSYAFELSLVLWLRGMIWARRGITVTATEGAPPQEVLQGRVCSSVPRGAKRVFRKLARHVLYLPLAPENLFGRSPTLLAEGRK